MFDVSVLREPLPEGCRVERMQLERDIDGVMAVEHACFLNHATREAFEREVRESDVSRVHVLRNASGTIVGFCASWVVLDELHVNSLAVLPEWRGRRLATGLLAVVLDASRAEGVRRATLEVRASNVPALALYERFGFRRVAVRRGYYTSPDEDALILWLDLPPPGPPAGAASA